VPTLAIQWTLNFKRGDRSHSSNDEIAPNVCIRAHTCVLFLKGQFSAFTCKASDSGTRGINDNGDGDEESGTMAREEGHARHNIFIFIVQMSPLLFVARHDLNCLPGCFLDDLTTMASDWRRNNEWRLRRDKNEWNY
jgi:hypothetical protein